MFEPFLRDTSLLQITHPTIRMVHDRLSAASRGGLFYAQAAYSFVRDDIKHSLDDRRADNPVTAVETLEAGAGLCFAKSALLVALLRAHSIPAGFCYQRIRYGAAHTLHGLIAVHLDGHWHRQDPRGNTPVLKAEFSLAGEQLSFRIDPRAGEVDYRFIFFEPPEQITAALSAAPTAQEAVHLHLPDRLTEQDTRRGVVLVKECAQ